MLNCSDIIAINEGFDPVLVGVCGGEELLNEGAYFQAFKLRFSKEAREAKKNLNEAKKYIKEKDAKNARASLDKAINKYEELKKMAQEIDDDNAVVVCTIAGLKMGVAELAAITILLLALESGSFLGGFAGGAGYVALTIGGWVWSQTPVNNFTTAMRRKLTQRNKAGFDGQPDPTQWNAVGVTRADCIVRINNMIKICKDLRKTIPKDIE